MRLFLSGGVQRLSCRPMNRNDLEEEHDFQDSNIHEEGLTVRTAPLENPQSTKTKFSTKRVNYQISELQIIGTYLLFCKNKIGYTVNIPEVTVSYRNSS